MFFWLFNLVEKIEKQIHQTSQEPLNTKEFKQIKNKIKNNENTKHKKTNTHKLTKHRHKKKNKKQ